jgi:ribosomal protein S18 acetylase RimI-like enzyme
VDLVGLDATSLTHAVDDARKSQHQGDSRHGAITFRPELAADFEFSSSLYKQTRDVELNATGWTDADKTSFCRQQFDAQHEHYENHYPRAQFLMIELDGRAIGRLYFEQTRIELRLMEITISAEQRNRGIGGLISGTLLAHAKSKGIAMGLHVESFNPARRLYVRQGFRDVETRGIYNYMRVEP